MKRVNYIKKAKAVAIATTVLLGLATTNSLAQKKGVGIGTTNPDQSAILDLSSDSQGLLIPRLTLKQRNAIEKPAKGLIVYQTNMLSGVYVYDGTQWAPVSTTEARSVAATSEYWSTLGNEGITENMYIGTNDEASLLFKVNNFNSGKIDHSRGNLFLGYKTAQNSLGFNTVALGALALQKANNSGNNVAIGFQSMFANETGSHNLALGTGSLAANISGKNNIAIGSLAGYKSTGSGNVFLGFQSGYSEQSDNKLVIANDAIKTPLIYGDFANGKLGINTQDLSSTFNINSGVANTSGLRFAKLNSASPTTAASGKVLTVNASGEVVLTQDKTSDVVTYWQQTDNNISNINTGNVNVKNLNTSGILTANGQANLLSGLNVTGQSIFANTDVTGALNIQNMTASGTVNTKGLAVGTGGITIASFGNTTDKIVGVDAGGKLILIDKPVPTVTTTPTSSSTWFLDTDNVLKPKDETDVKITKSLNTYGLKVGWGGIRFTDLNSTYPNPFESNGLCLSLDTDGNFILTKLPTSYATGSTSTGSSVWGRNGNIIYAPGFDEKVVIGQGLNLPDGYSLYVRKGILTERLRVAVPNSAKWADYVFEKDYQLMPLNEVEDFIDENKHLPNVPSATEIADQGIDMAEMAAKQMEKIEELTLYLIKANKRIDELEKQVNLLNKK